MSESEKTGNVVKAAGFKTAGDWINRLMSEHCMEKNVGAVEAIPEVKNDDGEVVQKAMRGKKGKDVLNVDAIKRLAAENHFEVKDYPNPGMYRMNVGNMLRAAARKRHGLNTPTTEGLINGDTEFEFQTAPSDFEVNEKVTQNPDGSKVAKEPAAATAAE